MSYENEDMPRVITQVRADHLQKQLTRGTQMQDTLDMPIRSEIMTDWFWPVMLWMVLLGNGVILGIGIVEMLRAYSAWIHAMSVSVTVLSYIACAFTYRYVVLPALIIKKGQPYGKHGQAVSGSRGQPTSDAYTPAT